MAPNDLTTLLNVKNWLQGTAGASAGLIDVITAAEITRVSGVILGWIGRGSLLYRPFTEVRSGTGGNAMMLKNYPVGAVASLVVNNQAIVAGPPNSASGQVFSSRPGFYFEPWDGLPPGRPQRLSLVGSCFTRNVANVTVTYSAGYAVLAEAQVVPAGTMQVVPLAPYGLMVADVGVTYANGTALTAVAASPTAGQYVAPSPLAAAPVNYYLFSAGDVGQTVLLSYSYVAAGIEGAACELVAERIRYRDRIGQRSKSLGTQETVSFDISDIPAYIKTSLQLFRSVVPIY